MVGSRTTVNLGNMFPSHNKNVIPVNHLCISLHIFRTEAYMHKWRKRKRLLWWWCVFGFFPPRAMSVFKVG